MDSQKTTLLTALKHLLIATYVIILSVVSFVTSGIIWVFNKLQSLLLKELARVGPKKADGNNGNT